MLWSHSLSTEPIPSERIDHHTWDNYLYDSLRTVGVFGPPTEFYIRKGRQTAPTVYRPYPGEKSNLLTVCIRRHYKGSTFFSTTPSVGP